MATEELRKESIAEGLELRDREKIENPAELLQDSLNGLNKYGGFTLLKGLMKGVEMMDPSKKATKNIFLNDSELEQERRALKTGLKMWLSILEAENGKDAMSDNASEQMKEHCEKAREEISKRLQKNLKTVREKIKRMEITYRTLNTFFANVGQGKVDCLTLMNVDRQQLWDFDSNDSKAIKKELSRYYDRLNLKNNYSLLVIPGYMVDVNEDDKEDFEQHFKGNAIKPIISSWAKTAYKNKVIMVTDFQDADDFDSLMMMLDKANLQDTDVQLSNTVMTCNYLFGRKKSEQAGEEEDLYLPGSAALAGRMANTEEVVISQGVAGKKYGTLDNVMGAKFDLLKSEISALIDKGVVPMVEEDGRTMAFSDNTLYNPGVGGSLGLQEYPIVRVFDWIGKVFQQYFNDQFGRVWDSSVRSELNQKVHDFLSGIKGPGELIENYNLKKIEQDPNTKDIKIEVELKPFFAAKNFLIELTGHDGKAGAEWDQKVN